MVNTNVRVGLSHWCSWYHNIFLHAGSTPICCSTLTVRAPTGDTINCCVKQIFSVHSSFMADPTEGFRYQSLSTQCTPRIPYHLYASFQLLLLKLIERRDSLCFVALSFQQLAHVVLTLFLSFISPSISLASWNSLNTNSSLPVLVDLSSRCMPAISTALNFTD